MGRHALTRPILWLAGFAASGFAWAWLNLGVVPIGILAAALLWDARRNRRTADQKPGLPQPMDGHRAAAYLTAALLVALVIGYRPDWLVFGGLGIALVVKAAAMVRPGGLPA